MRRFLINIAIAIVLSSSVVSLYGKESNETTLHAPVGMQQSTVIVSADTTHSFYLGVYGNMLLNSASADVSLNRATLIPRYSSNISKFSDITINPTIGGGILGEYMLHDNIALVARLGYSQYTATLAEYNQAAGLRAPTGGQTEPDTVFMDFELTTDYTMLNAGLGLLFSVGDFRIGIMGELMPIFANTATYTETEVLGELPTYGYTGELENINTLIWGAQLQLSYRIRLGEKFSVVPEVGWMPISANISAIPEATMSFTNIRAGLSLQVGLGERLINIKECNECPVGFGIDPDCNCVPLEPCPPGSQRNAEGNCMPLPPCEEGMERDSEGNCVPKPSTAPIVKTEPVPCAEGTYRNTEGECVTLTPPLQEDCVGDYIAFETDGSEQEAKELLGVLEGIGLTNLKVYKVVDAIDSRVVVYKVRTGCFSSENDAGLALRSTKKLLREKGIKVSIILETNK